MCARPWDYDDDYSRHFLRKSITFLCLLHTAMPTHTTPEAGTNSSLIAAIIILQDGVIFSPTARRRKKKASTKQGPESSLSLLSVRLYILSKGLSPASDFLPLSLFLSFSLLIRRTFPKGPLFAVKGMMEHGGRGDGRGLPKYVHQRSGFGRLLARFVNLNSQSVKFAKDYFVIFDECVVLQKSLKVFFSSCRTY